MSVDIATLSIEIKSDGIPIATARLKDVIQQSDGAEKSTSKLTSSFDRLSQYARLAAEALALYKLAQMAKDAALLAARYETLGVVMTVVGNNTGYTGKQMAGFQADLQKTGISAIASRQALAQMAEGQVDFARSAELARVAQDAAVIANTNSSDAFGRMTTGIATGQAIILHHMGLMTDFEGGYARYAATLHKTTGELTEHEKVQARVNEVIRASAGIAGSYEAAMGTAGKQINSMKRYTDNLQVSIGGIFSDALLVGVESFSGGLKRANVELDSVAGQQRIKDLSEGIVTALSYAADSAHGFWVSLQLVGESLTMLVRMANSIEESGVNSIMDLIFGDMGQAEHQVESLTSILDTFKRNMDAQLSSKTPSQIAAEMFAERLNNLRAESEKAAQIEQQRIAAAAVTREQADFDSWQRQYAKRAELAQKDYDRQKAAIQGEIDIASARDSVVLDSLQAQYNQGLISASAYLDQKYALESAAADRTITLAADVAAAQKSILDDLAANPATDPRVMAEYTAKYEEAKKAYQLADIARSKVENDMLIQRVKLMGEEAERAKIKTALTDLFGLRQRQIDIDRENGLSQQAFEEQKVLDLQKLQFEYMERMAQYQKDMATAEGERLAILQEAADLYQSIAYQEQQAIEARTYQDQQSPQWASTPQAGGFFDTSNGATHTIRVSIPNPNYVDPKIEENRKLAESINTATKALNDNLDQRALEVQGLTDEAAVHRLLTSQSAELAKAQQDQVATGRLLEVQQAEYNKLLRDQQIARVTKETQTFFDVIKSATADLQNSAKALATSMRGASDALSKAYNDLSGGALSNLTPEQKYQQAKTALANTYQAASAKGDAALYAQLPSLVTAFLEQSRGQFAAGSKYTQDFSWAKDILSTSATATSGLATEAEKASQAAADQLTALNDIKTALTSGSTSTIPALLANLSTAQEALKGSMAAVQTSLDNNSAIATGITKINSAEGVLGALTTDGKSAAAWLASVNTSTGAVSTNTVGLVTALNPLGAISTNTGDTHAALTDGTATGYLTGKNTTGQIKSVVSQNIFGTITGQYVNGQSGQTITPLGGGQFGFTTPASGPNQDAAHMTTATGTVTNYQYYADGGLYFGGAAMMGERGPELKDSSPGYVYRADETKALFDLAKRGAGGSNATLNIKIVTPDERVVVEKTLHTILDKSQVGELVIYADGVGGL